MSSFDAAFLTQLKKRIEEHSESVLRNVADGQCPDYPAYQHYCGVLKGLRFLADEADDILSQIQKG